MYKPIFKNGHLNVSFFSVRCKRYRYRLWRNYLKYRA